MINRGEVISSALRSLGEVRDYNNTNYAIYKVAETIMNEVEDEISLFPYLPRNLVYRKLNLSTQTPDYEDRLIYSIEPDVISVVRLVKNVPFEIIGETLHTYEEGAVALCNVKIRLEEQNRIYFGVYKWLLCIKLTEAYEQYKKMAEYCIMQYGNETKNVCAMFRPTSFDYSKSNSEKTAEYRGGVY